MVKPKVFMVLSKVEKSLAFEWIVEELSQVVDFSFVLLNPSEKTDIQNFLQEKAIPVYHYKLNNKLDLILNFFRLLFLFLRKRPQIVHAHLFEASLLSISASRLIGIKKCMYTRHHGSYHLDYFPNMVKWDRWNNRLANEIIAISENVKNILIDREEADPRKIKTIPHGFKLELFKNANRVAELTEKYDIPKNAIVLGCISRYMEWKGLEYTIQAVAKVQNKYPNLFLLIANAHGPYEGVIKENLKKLKSNSYVEITFEPEVASLYACMDLFAHVPVDAYAEAFGQTYIEAMAAGLACVFTKSGIANDFVVDEKNALLVDYRSADEIENAIIRLIEDSSLVKKLSEQAEKDVQQFSLDKMIKSLQLSYCVE